VEEPLFQGALSPVCLLYIYHAIHLLERRGDTLRHSVASQSVEFLILGNTIYPFLSSLPSAELPTQIEIQRGDETAGRHRPGGRGGSSLVLKRKAPMALQGTLKDFSITEIIQLIGQQLKTGVLRIRRGKKLVEISFVDGMIVHVYSNYRGQKDLIGEILVKAKLITEEQLERTLRIQKGTLKYLGEILVEQQFLTKDDVLKVISTQIYETIYDLFWWEDGTFSFDLKLVESYKKIPFALSTEHVLLNILRMVDEWSEIEKKISSPHLVFKKVRATEKKSSGSLSSQSYIKEKLSSEQELVYHLVDGARTVEEIIDRSLLGKFNTSEILSALLEMGLIEMVGVQTPTLIKKVSMVSFREAFGYVYYGGFLLFLILVFVYFRPSFVHHFWESKIETVDLAVPDRLTHQMQLSRIKNALEIYYFEKGQYPNSLKELVSARLLRKDDLFYRKGIAYRYELRDGKYYLKH
jgi:Domain of unknown function (DUF4388)